MSYQYITKYDSPNRNGYGVKNIPKYIVVHHWGADGQSFSGVLNWLCNPAAQVSAHYILKDNTVACILNHADCGWHVGNVWYNTHSIGIECRPEMTDGDIQTLVELIHDIWKSVGTELPVIGHKDVVATACPGRYYTRLAAIEEMARNVDSTEQIPLVPTKPTPEPSGELYRVRLSWEDVKSQIGAFRSRKSAVALASSREGYKVYDIKGNCVWERPNTPDGDVFDTNRALTVKEAIAAGQAWSNRILGTNIKVDGIAGGATQKNGVKILQWALKKDYGAKIKVDGIEGPATRSALGNHYVKKGETQYLVTAVQILLLMNGYNPHGVEKPGTFGSGCEKAVINFQKGAGLYADGIAGKNTILTLLG